MREEIYIIFKELLGIDFQKDIHNPNFIAFPNKRNPKLLFPKNLNRKGLSNSLDLYPVLSPKHFVKKNVVSLLYQFHFILPSSFTLSIGDGDLAKTLYKIISDQRHNDQKVRYCSIRTGSAGKGRKLIVQFMDKKGNIISYIKLGDIQYRGKWLENEMIMLDYVNSSCSDIITVPHVLGYKKSSSFAALEISPLTKYMYFPQVPFIQLIDTLSKIALRTKTACNYDFNIQEEYISGLFKSAETIEFILRHLETIKNTNGFWSLSHRDLPAWNVMSNNEGDIAILDWEFASKGHNPFQDIFHYKIHTTLHNSGKSPEKVLYYFFRDKTTMNAVKVFGHNIGIKDPDIIWSYFIFYLWDWYQLERSNSSSDNQGKEYHQMLTYLASNENSNKYFV